MADFAGSPERVLIDQWIDDSPVSRGQVRALALCCLVAALDGLDTQALALVAPMIMQEWGLPRAEAGLLLSAAPLGITLGGLTLGPLADRYGRRPMIIGSMATFGLFTALLAVAPNMLVLGILRLLAGIGMGGAVSNLVTLSGEIAPMRRRSLFVTIAFCGVPTGAVASALAAILITPHFGWRGLFALGGLSTLVALALIVAALPESPRFLAARRGDDPRLSTRLARLLPHLPPNAVLAPGVAEGPRAAGLGSLFAGRQAARTLLLWLAFVQALLVVHFLASWLPQILLGAGLPSRASMLSVLFLNLGAVVGGLSIGRLMDRFGGTRILLCAYVLGGLAVLLTPLVLGSPVALMTLILLVGTVAVGGQVGMNALASSLYPTAARGAGVGWAAGIGRLGAVMGPSVGGVLLATAWGAANVFAIVAGILALCALSIGLLGRRQAA